MKSDPKPCFWATCGGGMSEKASIFPGNAHLAALLFSRDGGLDAPLSACVSAQRPLVAQKILVIFQNYLYVSFLSSAQVWACLVCSFSLRAFCISWWQAEALHSNGFHAGSLNPTWKKNVNRWKKKIPYAYSCTALAWGSGQVHADNCINRLLFLVQLKSLWNLVLGFCQIQRTNRLIKSSFICKQLSRSFSPLIWCNDSSYQPCPYLP